MITQTPTKFRSKYTGAQIDDLLTSISNKIDSSYIVNDFSGGANLIASAELAKILYLQNQRLGDPNYIKTLILSIPGAAIYTTADADKLNRLAGAFQGSFANAAARNLAVNPGAFKGGELTFLINDGNGQQELSFWNATTLAWTKSQFIPNANTTPVTYTTAGDNIVFTLDTTKYEAAKYMIKAKNGPDILVFEMLACFAGTETYWTSQGYIGSNFNIAKITSCSLTSTTLRITMNLLANTIITFTRIVEV